jgi:hypothetical protein
MTPQPPALGFRVKSGWAAVVLCAGLVLLLSVHQLPAPISEVSESPTPAPAERAKPKPKRVTESQSNRATKSQPASATAAAPAKKFAGKWSGILPEVPWGNVQTELVVDPTEATIEWRQTGSRNRSAKTQLIGNTLSARFPVGLTTAVWFITPRSDETTADIRMTAFANDDHAVFQRITR